MNCCSGDNKEPVRGCSDATAMYYPNKMGLKEFLHEIRDNLEPFGRNMTNLGGECVEKKYAEDWMLQFAAWMEMEKA